jgi:SAM-dependent methyltransferase
MAEEFFIRKAHLDDCGPLLECLALAFAPYRQAYTPGAFADTVLDRQTLRHRLNEMTVLVAITTENRHPGLKFEEGDMRSLRIPSDALGGIIGFYSIIHIARTDVVDVLREMKRILRPGGQLLLSFHIGDSVLHRHELCGIPVSLDFTFFEIEEMKRYLNEAGLKIAETIERAPYPDVEYPSRRAYIFGEKPRWNTRQRA